jgi:SAM-dependent methyltransferase
MAEEFLQWLPVGAGKAWLDVGCGTAVLSTLILNTQNPATVTGVDSSPAFIAFAQAANSDPRGHFEVALAQSLPFEAAHFDAAVSGLMLNFVPQPEEAVAEMRRVTKPGGIVAAYVWDYAEGMQMLRYFWESAVSLDEYAAKLDEGTRFPLCQQNELAKLFQYSGLFDVQARAIEKPMRFANFDNYWRPFLGGVGPAPSYVKGLAESQQHSLQEQLRAALPISEDGSILLSGRVWAVCGVV